jgi:nucleoside diphosphate kinase homolog 5
MNPSEKFFFWEERPFFGFSRLSSVSNLLEGSAVPCVGYLSILFRASLEGRQTTGMSASEQAMKRPASGSGSGSGSGGSGSGSAAAVAATPAATPVVAATADAAKVERKDEPVPAGTPEAATVAPAVAEKTAIEAKPAAGPTAAEAEKPATEVAKPAAVAAATAATPAEPAKPAAATVDKVETGAASPVDAKASAESTSASAAPAGSAASPAAESASTDNSNADRAPISAISVASEEPEQSKEEAAASMAPETPEEAAAQEHAAVKIQSIFRGANTRKALQGKHGETEKSAAAAATAEATTGSEAAAVTDDDAASDAESDAASDASSEKPEEEDDRTIETTLALVKPDAVAKGCSQAIKRRIVEAGFTIVQEKVVRFHPLSIRGFYAEHVDKPFFPKLAKFMTSGPTRALVLARQDAVKAWRELMGPTDSDTARLQAPNTLRALYGIDKTRNAVHGSDSREAAAREISVLFPQQLPQPQLANPREYIEQAVSPTLTEGLAALCKHKPANPALWLANWLLQHNPNKPQVTMPSTTAQTG